MEERKPHHTYEIQRRLSTTPQTVAASPVDFGKKIDSGSAR
jgi:hypothetical protein